MANFANVMVRVIPSKEGVYFYNVDFEDEQWQPFAELFCADAVEEGFWQEQNDCFEVIKKWHFMSYFGCPETVAYLAWLRDQGFDSVLLDFMDFETGVSFIGFGSVEIKLAAEQATYRLTYADWQIADFGTKHAVPAVTPDNELTYDEKVWEKGFGYFKGSFRDMLVNAEANEWISIALPAASNQDTPVLADKLLADALYYVANTSKGK